MRLRFQALLQIVALMFAAFGLIPVHAIAGTTLQVLRPIESGNLAVFPVVSAETHDTSEFLTLDEGLRSGEVVVTEAGNVAGLIRGPHPIVRHDDAQVNTLVLINRSDRPLILLAGEIVTGGKQDRIIGKDRIVPAHSDPIDLSVFCVEPHRWVERSANFSGMSTQMAQPNVRASAMAAKNQSQVWANVQEAQRKAQLNAPPPDARAIGGTSSYAQVMSVPGVTRQVDSVAAPIEKQYHDVMRQLRNTKAVGVVVAVNGQIIWADVFASTELLEKYWPKLVRSYAAEAVYGEYQKHLAGIDDAQSFLNKLSGEHEVVDSEPGVYRQAEITGSNFTAFELTSLLPKTGFDVHIAKMQTSVAEAKSLPVLHRYIPQ